MIQQVLEGILFLEDILWLYFGIPLIMAFGIILTFMSRCFQLRSFGRILKLFWGFFKKSQDIQPGVHPLKAFFASIGGCIGVGNVVVVCTAVQIGGPGALFWIWVAAFFGMLIKYAEIYLGIKYRVPNLRGSYSGGPIYYLQRVFKSSWMPKVVCLLLCIYGVEVLQFNIVVQSVSHNYGLNPFLVMAGLLFLVLYAGAGGVRRVGELCSAIIPLFTFFYVSMGIWVLVANAAQVPSVLATVFSSAFTGHAPVGVFAGSSIVLAMSQGVRRGCYTGDVGIGYASVIHSETTMQKPAFQASLAIMEIFIDTFVIVTTSLLVILVTGVWKEPIHESRLVQTAFAAYYPHVEYIMPIFLFLLGYSTIIAYFCFGLNSSEFLSQKWGRKVYYVVSAMAFIAFSFVESAHALSVMAICGALLLIVNIVGMYKLRKEIGFNLDED